MPSPQRPALGIDADTARLEIDVEADEVDWVSGLLWAAGVSAVEERTAADGIRLTLVTAPDLPAVRATLGDRWPVRSVPFDDAVLDTWRAWARPVAVGRLLVVPAWHDLPPHPPDAVVVRLDPGRAFGHGDHPTTRAVLGALDAHLMPGDRVLDVGTGSGVLAVAAALLGSGPVVAVDISPEAIRATAANAAANGVTNRIDVSSISITRAIGTFELVLANLGAETLIDLADDLCGRVADGGRLVVSGLLADRQSEVAGAFEPFRMEDAVVEDGWCTLTLTRTAERQRREPGTGPSR